MAEPTEGSSPAVGFLRDQVARAEAGIEPPSDLFERVRDARLPAARRWSLVALAAAAAIGVLLGVAGTAWWQQRSRPAPMAHAGSVTLAVYNAELGCQTKRIIECGLSINSDPRNPTSDKVVARAWHGDTVTATCVVADGKLIADEEGVSSRRWYRVTTADQITGYLPGVRLRNTVELAPCPR